MKAWAQSGYHRLSPASREFEATQKTLAEAARPRGSLKSLLKPYEKPSERSLIRQTRALRTKLSKAFAGVSRVFARLQRALGAPRDEREEREESPCWGMV